jgi:hypothetical protein
MCDLAEQERDQHYLKVAKQWQNNSPFLLGKSVKTANANYYVIIIIITFSLLHAKWILKEGFPLSNILESKTICFQESYSMGGGGEREIDI